VIQRSHQQHHIETRGLKIRKIDRTAVHETIQRYTSRLCLIASKVEVILREIEQGHVITLLRQCNRIPPRPAANIQHAGWRFGQVVVKSQHRQCIFCAMSNA